MKNKTIKKLNSIFNTTVTKEQIKLHKKKYNDNSIIFWGELISRKLEDFVSNCEQRELDPCNEVDSFLLDCMEAHEGIILTNKGSEQFDEKQLECIGKFEKIFGQGILNDYGFRFDGGLHDL